MTGQTNAEVTSDRRDPWTFLTLSKTLWQAARSAPGSKVTFAERVRRCSGQKLVGVHRFDFTFDLPQSITYDSVFADNKHDFPLPASFTEQGAMRSVTYEVELHIKRGILSTDIG